MASTTPNMDALDVYRQASKVGPTCDASAAEQLPANQSMPKSHSKEGPDPALFAPPNWNPTAATTLDMKSLDYYRQAKDIVEQ
jgi:hypothetical protein